MRQAKYKLLKLTTLAIAIVATGGCVTAKTNPGDKEAMAAPAPEKEMAEPTAMKDGKVTSYTVAKGDHLWGISEMSEIYGTPYNWPLIYKSNSSQINDADLIFPGQEMDIPVIQAKAQSTRPSCTQKLAAPGLSARPKQAIQLISAANPQENNHPKLLRGIKKQRVALLFLLVR